MPNPLKIVEEYTSKDLELFFVEDYFKENPSESKCSRKNINPYTGKALSGSYLREPNGNIFQMAGPDDLLKILGEGSFGRVKSAEKNSAIKILSVTSIDALEKAIAEANRNLDLHVATGAPIVIEKVEADGTKSWKLYQRMTNLGVSLKNKLQYEQKALEFSNNSNNKSIQAQKELDRAIELCFLIDDLHQGNLSSSHTQYAHADIKPDNILIDSNNRLHLIDFGSATTEVQGVMQDFRGTIHYAPICPKDLSTLNDSSLLLTQMYYDLLQCCKKEDRTDYFTYAEQDKFAMLRSIYHPLQKKNSFLSIISESTFSELPEFMRNLLDTSIISEHISEKRRGENPHFFAAALILYKEKKESLTPEDIENLRHNPELQEQLIAKEKEHLLHSQSEITLPENKEQSELDKVELYFKQNPDATKYSRKLSGFDNSYLKDAKGNIFSVASKSSPDHLIGEGAKGRVKGTQDNDVVKIQWIHSIEDLKRARQEAQINIDMGTATSALIERSFLDENNRLVFKVYQKMRNCGDNLGTKLAQRIEPTTTEEKKKQQTEDVNLSIQLTLRVMQMHNGELSHSGTKYAHKDIKPENLLIDANGQLTLIDNGLTTPAVNGAAIIDKFEGTLSYAPIDTDIIGVKETEKLAPLFGDFIGNLNERHLPLTNAMQDQVATYRTLWLPPELRSHMGKKGVSIISESTYELLDKPIRDLLSTEQIMPFIDPSQTPDRTRENLQLLSAVLIQYRNNNYQITEDEVKKLKEDCTLQLALIQEETMKYPNRIPIIEPPQQKTDEESNAITEQESSGNDEYLSISSNTSEVHITQSDFSEALKKIREDTEPVPINKNDPAPN